MLFCGYFFTVYLLSGHLPNVIEESLQGLVHFLNVKNQSELHLSRMVVKVLFSVKLKQRAACSSRISRQKISLQKRNRSENESFVLTRSCFVPSIVNQIFVLVH